MKNPPMDQLDQIRIGLNIFAELMPLESDRAVAVEHDVMYAGPDPSTVSEENRVEIETFGWHAEEEFDCFYHFV